MLERVFCESSFHGNHLLRSCQQQKKKKKRISILTRVHANHQIFSTVLSREKDRDKKKC